MLRSVKIALFAASSLSIAACVPAAAPYKAIGTEPFWSLTIEGETIAFQPMEGAATVAQNVTARPSINGWRYTSDSVSVDVTYSQCSDGMSDTVYKDTVTVLLGTTEYRGCGGGAVTPGAMLSGAAWHFVDIDGQPVVTIGNGVGGARPGIQFDQTSIGVNAGCNGGGTVYVSGNSWLKSGLVTATQMACEPPLMDQEDAAFALVRDARWSVDGEGYLVLQSDAHTARLRRDSEPFTSRDQGIEPRWEDRIWNVVSLDGEYDSFSGYGPSDYQVTFANGRMSAKVGCNQMTGDYSIDGDLLVVGPLSATRMACAPELMERDRRFAALMESRPKFAMSPNRELLIGSKENVLMLQGSHTKIEAEK